MPRLPGSSRRRGRRRMRPARGSRTPGARIGSSCSMYSRILPRRAARVARARRRPKVVYTPARGCYQWAMRTRDAKARVSRGAAVLLLFVLALALLPAGQSEFKGSFQEEMMPARDGIRLATNVFVPEGKGPHPAVLMRTPYGKDGRSKTAVPGSNRLQAAQYASRGYALVVQDCRGTGRSEGENVPFRSDQYDGCDAVEWIARQTWSNGKVAMVGASALGITTTLAATLHPPHLVCAFVVVTPADIRRDTLYMGGVYRKEMNDGWLRSQGKTDQIAETVGKSIADPYWD